MILNAKVRFYIRQVKRYWVGWENGGLPGKQSNMIHYSYKKNK